MQNEGGKVGEQNERQWTNDDESKIACKCIAYTNYEFWSIIPPDYTCYSLVLAPSSIFRVITVWGVDVNITRFCPSILLVAL